MFQMPPQLLICPCSCVTVLNVESLRFRIADMRKRLAWSAPIDKAPPFSLPLVFVPIQGIGLFSPHRALQQISSLADCFERSFFSPLSNVTRPIVKMPNVGHSRAARARMYVITCCWPPCLSGFVLKKCSPSAAQMTKNKSNTVLMMTTSLYFTLFWWCRGRNRGRKRGHDAEEQHWGRRSDGRRPINFSERNLS